MLTTLASEGLPLPPDEAERLDILRQLRLGEASADASLDALAEAARSLTGCAFALVSVVDAHHTWHVARAGLNLTGSAREASFCAQAITDSRFFEVPNLSLDPRFSSHPLVLGEPRLRHYAAAALVVEGCVLGTLCVLDASPGELAPAAREHLQRLAGVVSEMLRQRRLRMEAEDQNERLRDLARASGDWAWELDADLHCRWIAGDFEAVTGLKPASVIGKLVAAEPLVDANGSNRLPARNFLDVLAERRPFSRIVTRMQTPRGAVLVSRSALPVFDALGAFRGYRGTTRDVTARVERESLLRDKAALEDISRAKSEFLSRVSHELRTPLNAILGFAQLMSLDREQPLSPSQQHRLEGVRRAGEHLLEMINDVLDIARIEQGAQSLQAVPLNLAELAATCVNSVQPLASARPVELHLQVPQGLYAKADAHALEQVLLNLLSNAIKFNRPQGRVDISAQADGPRVMLTVTDSGVGMPADDIAHLFQPFNRLGAERRRVPGSGLGLVIVRQLVRAMGGEVLVSSAVERGSSFSVVLPSANATSTVAPAPPRYDEVPAPSAAPRQVLYIEDEPLNVLLMQEVFRARPAWTLHVAEEGLAGVEAALRLQPDLALIDMNLPDINGLEVLRRLRAHPGTRQLRCIALSADAMDEQIATARAAGFDDYWTKPIDLNHLLSAVAQAFEQPRVN